MIFEWVLASNRNNVAYLIGKWLVYLLLGWMYWLASGHAPTYEQSQPSSTLNLRPPRGQVLP